MVLLTKKLMIHADAFSKSAAEANQRMWWRSAPN